MTTLATPKSIIDPLSAFEAGAFTADSKLPVPLILTRFDISVDGAFVTVETKRVFRNVETRPIEATITFPVPVHAILFDLEARIDKRLLKPSWNESLCGKDFEICFRTISRRGRK